MKCHIALCEEATIIVLNLCAWTQSDKSYKDIPHSDGFRNSHLGIISISFHDFNEKQKNT